MNCHRHFAAGLAIAILLAGGLVAGMPARAQTPLSADEIIVRAVARAEARASGSNPVTYAYTRHTIADEMDATGRLKDRKERLYDALFESGITYLTLIKVNGQSLSPAALRKQAEREAAERAKLMDAKPGQKGEGRDNLVTPELVAHYKFTLLGERAINGRAAYLLSFEPKSGNLPIKKFTDRFLNKVEGDVWIDESEFEIARFEVHLRGEVTLWGGLIGALRRCDYTMARTRLPDGMWFDSFSHGYFEGRKLVEPMLIRTMAESRDFHKLAIAKN